MPNHSRLLSLGSLSFLPIVFALAASAGCSSGGAGDAASSASSNDALTSDEQAAGASWDGVDEDDLSPQEQADLATTDDPLAAEEAGSDGSGDVQTASFGIDPSGVHTLSGCTHLTGYNHGTVMSICATVIDGKPVEQSTADAFVKMHDAAKADGVSIVVVSGFRSMAQQRQLYAAYKAGRGNLAAPPGYSNHQSGHALDLNTKAPGVKSWLIQHAASFGFRRTVPSEDWHYEKW